METSILISRVFVDLLPLLVLENAIVVRKQNELRSFWGKNLSNFGSKFVLAPIRQRKKSPICYFLSPISNALIQLNLSYKKIN